MNFVFGSSSNGFLINMFGIDNGEGICLWNVFVFFNDIEINLVGMYGKVCKVVSLID